ncbi:hypothetical protein [Rhizobium oryzihabitans]|uniref:hypothetical protein n=1 Tax=Rhizobium oryzihabitans TaxID=2267833 RepID=UPI001AED8FF3
MKDAHFAEQEHADARTFPLTDFRPRLKNSASMSAQRIEPLTGRAKISSSVAL